MLPGAAAVATMTHTPVLVLTTCADGEAAGRLAESIVAARLAACVSTIGGVHSTYRWNGKVERGTEAMLLIKTTTFRYQALEQHILEHGGYELPEIVAVRPEDGLRAYFDWISQETA